MSSDESGEKEPFPIFPPNLVGYVHTEPRNCFWNKEDIDDEDFDDEETVYANGSDDGYSGTYHKSQIEKLLYKRIGENGKIEYSVKWKEFGDENNSWIEEKNLTKDLLEKFEKHGTTHSHLLRDNMGGIEIKDVNGKRKSNYFDCFQKHDTVCEYHINKFYSATEIFRNAICSIARILTKIIENIFSKENLDWIALKEIVDEIKYKCFTKKPSIAVFESEDNDICKYFFRDGYCKFSQKCYKKHV